MMHDVCEGVLGYHASSCPLFIILESLLEGSLFQCSRSEGILRGGFGPKSFRSAMIYN